MATNKVKLTIVVCYQQGTQGILSCCLHSIYRHTKIPFSLSVVTRASESEQSTKEIWDVYGGLDPLPSQSFNLCVEHIDDNGRLMSGVHGALLDANIPSNTNSEYVLTMDSDCFPVADGWLESLFGMIENGARIVGILHPWAPPPVDMPKSKIEWRVRSQHCWETTHVACQMLRVEDFVSLGVKYNGGDDTGLAIPIEAKKRGWKIDGFRVTRCPKQAASDGINTVDPEFNRYVGLVFGDKIYHHGGFTRQHQGDSMIYGDSFGWVRERVLNERGAEFLLEDEWSYKFRFDREEEIAREKMGRLFGFRGRELA